VSGWGDPRIIDIAGLSYAVRLTGSPGSARAAVVMLHGFSGSSEDWTETASALAAAGYAAVGIDLPGHGLTEIPGDPRRFTMPSTARDLTTLITTLGIAHAHWLGYSMGGRVALYMGVTEPVRAASLILEAATPGIEEEPARKERRDRDEALASEIGARGIPWFVDHWESLPIFESQRGLSKETLEAQRSRRLRNTAAGLAGSLRGLGQGAREFLGPRLSSIRRPALLLAGGLDLKYATIAQQMGASIPGAEVVIVPGAGHNVHLEKPGAFHQAILGRLHRLEAESPSTASLPA